VGRDRRGGERRAAHARAPARVEVVNLRSVACARAWCVEHAPSAMTPDEALAYGRERMRRMRAAPLVVLHPDDERPAEK